MSIDLIAYKSTDPEVLASVVAAQDKVRDYARQVRAVLDGLGLARYQMWVSQNGWHPGQFVGIEIPQGEFSPEGWRTDREGRTVPDRRTAAGRRAWKALEAVRHPGDPRRALIGMPHDLLTPGGYQTPGLRVIAGAVYVHWRNCDPAGGVRSFSGQASEVDESRWQRFPASEYYAAIEADEAQDGAS